MTTRNVQIVEVGPRDGFQPIEQAIPTERKIDLVARLHAAGIRRMEATAFVSPRAVPQMADAAEVLDAAHRLEGLDTQVLVPTRRYAEQAIGQGARHLAFVLSASAAHNRNNVRRSPEESADEFVELAGALPAGVRIRLNLATAFDCPFEGRIEPAQVIELIDRLQHGLPGVELCLCDTTGRTTPDAVSGLFDAIGPHLPDGCTVAFHGHDTYGLGVANALAAYHAGVDVFDASFGGLGGCPFAPGATGNVATEDLVWTFERMGIPTGIDLDALIDAATDAATIPGACPGGRVRTALAAARGRESSL